MICWSWLLLNRLMTWFVRALIQLEARMNNAERIFEYTDLPSGSSPFFFWCYYTHTRTTTTTYTHPFTSTHGDGTDTFTDTPASLFRSSFEMEGVCRSVICEGNVWVWRVRVREQRGWKNCEWQPLRELTLLNQNTESTKLQSCRENNLFGRQKES